MHKFLIHKKGDHVGIASQDIHAGESVIGVYMDDDSTVEVVAKASIPLGHKIAVANVNDGSDVIEYGHIIGLAKTDLVPGDYVHVHNIKSTRW